MEKIHVDLSGVPLTLFFPVWGRAREMEKDKPALHDKVAVEVMDKVDFDFESIDKNINRLNQFAWIRRSLFLDDVIKEFIRKHPKATIVNVGCGLDTTFERVDNGTLFWYDLDLPEVIELRKKFISENVRRKFIAGSFLSTNWFERLWIEDNVLFIAGGVLYYFDGNQVQEMFKKIADAFPGAEFAFDATSAFGVKTANKVLVSKSGLKEDSFLRWGLERAEDLKIWDSRIKVIKQKPCFRNGKAGMGLRLRMLALVADYYRMGYFVQIKFLKS